MHTLVQMYTHECRLYIKMYFYLYLLVYADLFLKMLLFKGKFPHDYR